MNLAQFHFFIFCRKRTHWTIPRFLKPCCPFVILGTFFFMSSLKDFCLGELYLVILSLSEPSLCQLFQAHTLMICFFLSAIHLALCLLGLRCICFFSCIQCWWLVASVWHDGVFHSWSNLRETYIFVVSSSHKLNFGYRPQKPQINSPSYQKITIIQATFFF